MGNYRTGHGMCLGLACRSADIGRKYMYEHMEEFMEELRLVRPSSEHKEQYEEMMEEWEAFGGRLNPGMLRRRSDREQKEISYGEWLTGVEEKRHTVQDLYFLMRGNYILGAISIRCKCAEVDGHSGFGIRPSERRKGYAVKMLSLALPIMKKCGINPVIISCAKDNVGSAKVIRNNGGRFIREAVDDDGELVQIYYIEV